MTAIPAAATFSFMAKKEATDQINFRLKTATIERMETYRARHPLHPTMTQMVEAAMKDWLDRNEPFLPKPLK